MGISLSAIVVPGIANVVIALFKDTTLVLIISLFDFLGMIQAALTDPNWLGFAAEGEGHKLVDEEATTFGGKVVVNPSGGLISKGHPLGATGLAQCSELTWQLRGQAD